MSVLGYINGSQAPRLPLFDVQSAGSMLGWLLMMPGVVASEEEPRN